MAKQRGPVASTFSGRVGNIVGAKLKGGEYVTRSYQPSVKNPKTLRQRVSRIRLATASGLAAFFGEAISVGYANAAAGTKMYPRNVFIKDIVPLGAGVITVSDLTPAVDYTKVQLSKKSGIAVKPTIQLVTDSEELIAKVCPTNKDSVVLGPGEQLGMVVVLFDSTSNKSYFGEAVITDDADSGVSFDYAEVSNMRNFHVYSFYKAIPASGNDVAQATEPWRYPSSTSATSYKAPGA